MKNKNVIRKKLVNGEFTTIHNSILFDTRLTPNAFRLMTAILSDSDTHFNLSQTLYCKRLKIAKQTFFNAVAKLEECGYLKKTPTGVNNTFNYTLSEYGNLNNTDTKEQVPSEIHDDKKTDNTSIDTVNTSITDMNEYRKEVKSFLLANISLMDDNFLKNVMGEAFHNNEPLNSLIEKFEKYLYKTTIASITDSHINPKSFEEFKAKVKNLIFNLKNYDANFMNSWTILKLTKNRKQAPRDHETEMGDYYENPID